jgi:hypothetical protein
LNVATRFATLVNLNRQATRNKKPYKVNLARS